MNFNEEMAKCNALSIETSVDNIDPNIVKLQYKRLAEMASHIKSVVKDTEIINNIDTCLNDFINLNGIKLENVQELERANENLANQKRTEIININQNLEDMPIKKVA